MIVRIVWQWASKLFDDSHGIIVHLVSEVIQGLKDVVGCGRQGSGEGVGEVPA